LRGRSIFGVVTRGQDIEAGGTKKEVSPRPGERRQESGQTSDTAKSNGTYEA